MFVVKPSSVIRSEWWGAGCGGLISLGAECCPSLCCCCVQDAIRANFSSPCSGDTGPVPLEPLIPSNKRSSGNKR